MTAEARARAKQLLEALLPFAERGIKIVGLEPSCLLTLRDELLVMGLGAGARTLAGQTLLFEEFIASQARAGRFAPRFVPCTRPILVHGHCHQKALRCDGFGLRGAAPDSRRSAACHR